MSSIYEPAEDSYLMAGILKEEISKLLKENPSLTFLEIGSGSGINLEIARKSKIRKENILGTDISKEAIEYCRKLGFTCIHSDLFKKVEGVFDLIVFNPPYLPLDQREEEESRQSTTGGKKGNEIIVSFLKQAKRHLNREGKILLLTSSLTSKIDFKKFGYKFERLDSKSLFFEKLFVFSLSRIG